MAYILGFIFADGNIDRNNLTLAIELQIRDKQLLEDIRIAMDSTHPIKLTKANKAVRLRVHSRIIIQDLKNLNVVPNKSKYCRCPKIPSEYLSHFLRGFLDGDGWVVTRTKDNRHEINVGFTGGCKDFLEELMISVRNRLFLTTFNLNMCKQRKKSGKISTVYSIDWYATNAIKLLDFIYVDKNIFLERKYKKYVFGKHLHNEYSLKTKVWRRLEAQYGTSLKEILYNVFYVKNLRGNRAANYLDVSSAHLYRLVKWSGLKNESKSNEIKGRLSRIRK